MLSTGLGLGQGSLFLVNTLLVAQGAYHRLADFGLAFNFATLFLLAVDAGSITTLARDTAVARNASELAPTISLAYMATTSVRLLVAITLCACAILYAALTDNSFLRAYAYAGALAPLLWAFNFSGILDGLRRSGIAGITSVSIYLLSAMGAWFTLGAPDWEAGLVLGFLLSVGTAVALAAQYFSVRAAGLRLAYVRPNRASFLTAAKTAGMMLLYTVPGQLFIRLQIIMSTAMLGPVATGLFIYGKQVSSGLAQVIHFARRGEFPELTSAFAARGRLTIDDAFGMQRTSLGVTLVVVVIVAAGFLVVSHTYLPSLKDASNVVLVLLPLVISSAVVATLSFALMASGRYGLTIWPAIFGLLLAIPMSYLAASLWGVVGLALAEGFAHLVALALLLRYFAVARQRMADG